MAQTPAQKFESLAKRLLAVPKAELDEKRKAREATKRKRRRSS